MDIVLRATVMFVILYVLLRLLGKRQLSEMTPFEMVVLIVMGDLIQQGVTHNDFSLTGASLAIGTFAFWSVVLTLAAFYFPSVERVLEGQPVVLVRHGDVLAKALERNRMSRGELESEMRLAGIAHLSQVAWAVLETNGKISFIKAGGEEGGRQQDEKSAAQ
jgi:uncharacterized membrane protein YcaP (DUF421 family)